MCSARTRGEKSIERLETMYYNIYIYLQVL